MKTSAKPKQPVMSFRDGKWELMGDVTAKWKNFTMKASKGYRCDLGSVPLVFQWIVKSTGIGNLGFLFHDHQYDEDVPDFVDKKGMPMNREQADEMMKDLLLYSGLSNWRAVVAWRGVRRGGWMSWKKAD